MNIKIEVINSEGYTKQETEVIKLMLCGFPDKSIANYLAISAKTVAVHIDKIYAKCGIKNAQINARTALIGKLVTEGRVRFYQQRGRDRRSHDRRILQRS